jgi:hypothetical protein
MRIKCPLCGEYGATQQRNTQTIRIAHYKGFEGKKRFIEWHCVTVKDAVLVNKKTVKVNNEGFLTLITKNEEKTQCLPRIRKIMSLAPKPG